MGVLVSFVQVLLVLVYWSGLQVNGQQVSVQPLSPLSGEAGEMGTLTCTVSVSGDTSGGTLSITWSGPGVGTTGVSMGAQTPLSGGTVSRDLTFDPLRESHDGDYTCLASFTTPGMGLISSNSEMTTVTVTRPTVSVQITASSPGTPTVGDSYSLTCSVSGADNLQPSITYQWSDPNGIIVVTITTQTQRVFTLTPLALSDAGMYTCEVTVSSPFLGSDITGLSDTMDVRVQIPTPIVEISGGSGTPLAGSPLTLTCLVTLDAVLQSILSDLTVVSDWSGPGVPNSRISQTGVMGSPPTNRFLLNTLTFNTLRTSDAGTYTCQAIVSPSSASSFVDNGVDSENVDITVGNPTLTAVLDANATRLPTHPDYNTYSLTCTATAPTGVVAEKRFTWRRELNGGGFTTLIDNGGTIQIETTNVDREVSTTVLTVRETTDGQYTYRCVAAFTDGGIVPTNDISDRRRDVDITVTGPSNPLQPQSLMETGITFESTTIQWTVPQLAYTPETYVVEYGTDSSSLDLRSETRMSGADFTTTNLMFSVTLTGLTHVTTYFYRVVATNTEGSTESNMDTFMTPDIPPDPPRNFWITVEGPTTLTFSWDAPDLTRGNPSAYDLTCTPTLSGIEVVSRTFPVPDPAASRSETVTNFEEGVTYNCSLRSRNVIDNSDPVYAIATTNAIAPSGPPQMFTVTAEGPRNLLFTWRAPDPEDRNGDITSYILTCRPPAPSVTFPQTFVTDIGNDVFDRSLSGFTPFVSYTCTLNTTNSEGNGPAATDTVTTPQDVPGRPGNFAHVTTPSDTTRVVFSWDSPAEANGIITSYIIRCIPTLTNLTDIVFNTTTDQTTTAISCFTPASRYNCTIAAYTIVGEGPETSGLTVITLPAAPEGVVVMNESCSELLVQFEVDPLHTEISEYRIYASFRGTDGSPQTMAYTCSGTQDLMSPCTCSDIQGPMVQCTIGGLPPVTDVEVEVAGVNSAGEGPRSAPDTERTLEGFPGEVSGPFWEHQTDTSVTVSWGEPAMPNGVILGYRVTLQRYEGGETEMMEVGETTLNVEFNNNNLQNVMLASGVPYSVTVTALNSALDNCEDFPVSPATTTNFTREEAPTASPPITNISRTGETMTVIFQPLSLVEARGFVSFYIIEFVPSTSRRRRRQSGAMCDSSPCMVPGDMDRVLIVGLDPGTTYSVTISTETGGGMGLVSDPITLIPPPSTTSQPKCSNTAAIVGGVVAGVFLICVTIIVVTSMIIFYLRWRSAKLFMTSMDQPVRWSEVAKSDDPNIITTKREAVKQGPPPEYEIPTTDCVAYGNAAQQRDPSERPQDVVYEPVN